MIDKIVLCTNCKKPAVINHRPFCSVHCQMVDLGRWLGEQYSIPGNHHDDSEDNHDT